MITENQSESVEAVNPDRAFRRKLEETILRSFLFSCALEKAMPRNNALSSTEDASLIDDLTRIESELQKMHDGAFIPAVLTIACEESRKWELNLLDTFSRQTDHWDSVLRLTFELEAIISLLGTLREAQPTDKTLLSLENSLQAHLNFQLQILGTWINTEEKHGRPAMKVVEVSKSEVAEAWPEVVEAVIGVDCVKKEPAAAQILQAIPEVGNAIAKTFARTKRPA